MSTTKKRSRSASQKTSHFKDMLLQIGSNFFRNFFEQLQSNIKAKVTEFVQSAKRVAIVTFLIVVGVLFLFIGMASLIDSALGIKGAGFLFVGIALALLGYLMYILSKSSK